MHMQIPYRSTNSEIISYRCGGWLDLIYVSNENENNTKNLLGSILWAVTLPFSAFIAFHACILCIVGYSWYLFGEAEIWACSFTSFVRVLSREREIEREWKKKRESEGLNAIENADFRYEHAHSTAPSKMIYIYTSVRPNENKKMEMNKYCVEFLCVFFILGKLPLYLHLSNS